MIKHYITGKVAVFIDAANMLYSQQTLGWQIDYKKLIAYLKKETNLVFVRFYYGMIKENKGQTRFFQMLKDRGYTLRTKPVKYIKTQKGTILKGNLDSELVFDGITLESKYESALLFSGDSDFEVIAKYLRKKNKKLVVFSTKGHISIELIRNCDKYIDLKKLEEVIKRNKKIPPKIRGKVYSDNHNNI